MTAARRRVAGLPALDRSLIMGVINVTPDSFSDGGLWMDTEDAVRHGLDLIAQGADVIDVGGESTRPGAVRIDAEEELRRITPVVRELAAAGATVSVDTMRADVAEHALAAGARVINDVSGGRADPRVLAVAADAEVPFVLMHWREHSATMQNNTHYDDVVADIKAEMAPQIEAALAAGIKADRLIVDPGLGFSKTGDQNWSVLSRLEEFHAMGFALLVAASRKRFIGELLSGEGEEPVPTDKRAGATAAVTVLAAAAGAWCVRVHEVPANLDAVRVAARWADG